VAVFVVELVQKLDEGVGADLRSRIHSKGLGLPCRFPNRKRPRLGGVLRRQRRYPRPDIVPGRNRRQPGTLAASTSTFSIFGGSRSRSEAFSMSALAMGPLRWASR